MIDNSDIVFIDIGPYLLERCKHHAKLASLGGRSKFRDEEDRKEKMGVDQLTGQLGNAAICIFLYGHEKGVEEYEKIRAIANANPWKGDGGRDVLDLDLDVKTSYIRHRGKPLLDYNLVVRPRERHEGFYYVPALVPDSLDCVALLGWANEQELPKDTESYGIFSGAYLLTAKKCNPMKTLTKVLNV